MIVHAFLMGCLLAGADPVREDPNWNDRTAALRVSARTRTGLTYQGIVLRSEAAVRAFAGEKAPDLDRERPDGRVTLEGFNGLSGSITLAWSDIASVSVDGSLDEKALAAAREARESGKKARLARERERLRIIQEKRAARAAAATAAGGTEEPPRTLSAQAAEWMRRFPPEQGWVPARKAQLYYQTVVLDNRPLTDEEREWLDHYDAWKIAYDEWLEIEQERLEREKEEQAGGAQATGGAVAVDPAAATAGSSAAPDVPKPPFEPGAMGSLPPIDPDAPPPVPVGGGTGGDR